MTEERKRTIETFTGYETLKFQCLEIDTLKFYIKFKCSKEWVAVAIVTSSWQPNKEDLIFIHKLYSFINMHQIFLNFFLSKKDTG